MLGLARRVGIEVPANRLIETDRIKGLPEDARTVGKVALAVERFDHRGDGTQVHIEDFAQVFGLYPGFELRRQPRSPCDHKRPDPPFCGGGTHPGEPALEHRDRNDGANSRQLKNLEHGDALPQEVRLAIRKQILGVATAVKKQ